MAGQLTTHVLDLVRGLGAGDLGVTLRRLDPDPADLGETHLDAGGRAVLLSGPDFVPGRYELVFKVGAYHQATGQAPSEDPPFLHEVPIRFGVADAGMHVHVPLLVSLYGYSTYRGG
jgi:5-hydroxyisourate hydrolase